MELPEYMNWNMLPLETSWNGEIDVCWRPKDCVLKPKTSRIVPLGKEAMLGATRVTTCSIESDVSNALEKAFWPRTLLEKLD